MFKKIIGIIIIALLVISGYFLLPQKHQQNQTKPDNKNEQTTTIPQDWKKYTTSTFSFSHPPEATIESEASKVKVQLIGPDSEEGTEITDGFTFYVEPEELPEGSDLSDFAQSKHDRVTQKLKSLQPPTSTTIGDRSAYKFVVQSELGGGSNRIILEGDNDKAFVISYNVQDPNNVGYKEQIEKMIKSLEITE